jgi:hypothetical protein
MNKTYTVRVTAATGPVDFPVVGMRTATLAAYVEMDRRNGTAAEVRSPAKCLLRLGAHDLRLWREAAK